MDPLTITAIGFGIISTYLSARVAKVLVQEEKAKQKDTKEISDFVNQIARSIEADEPGWESVARKHANGEDYTLHRNQLLNISFGIVNCRPQMVSPHRFDLNKHEVKELQEALVKRDNLRLLGLRLKILDTDFANSNSLNSASENKTISNAISRRDEGKEEHHEENIKPAKTQTRAKKSGITKKIS